MRSDEFGCYRKFFGQGSIKFSGAEPSSVSAQRSACCPFFGWPVALFTSNEPTIWLVAAALFSVTANFVATAAVHEDWYMLGLLVVPGVFGLMSSALHWPQPIKRKSDSEKKESAR